MLSFLASFGTSDSRYTQRSSPKTGVECSQSAVHSGENSQLLLTQQVLLLPARGGAAVRPHRST